MGWIGTYGNRILPMTCTSTDPLVATYFALECMFHNHAVVLFILRSSVEGFIGAPNHFDTLESAVNLAIKPLDIYNYVVHSIDVDEARDILTTMGFDRVPYQLYGKSALDDELELSLSHGHRLNPEQIAEFNRRAFEIRL